MPKRSSLTFVLRTREVHLPRFKLEKNYNLKDALNSMGVRDLFTSSADFSDITDEDINIGLVSIDSKISSILPLHNNRYPPPFIF